VGNFIAKYFHLSVFILLLAHFSYIFVTGVQIKSWL